MIAALRWTARLLGLAPAVIGWTFLIGEAFTDVGGDGEGIAVLVSLAALTIAALVAWEAERAGGLLEIAVALCFAVVVFVTAGHNRVLVAVLLPLPWFVSGLLFLAVDRLEARRASRPG